MAISNKIEFGFAESPFGSIIVARTWDGVCDDTVPRSVSDFRMRN